MRFVGVILVLVLILAILVILILIIRISSVGSTAPTITTIVEESSTSAAPATVDCGYCGDTGSISVSSDGVCCRLSDSGNNCCLRWRGTTVGGPNFVRSFKDLGVGVLVKLDLLGREAQLNGNRQLCYPKTIHHFGAMATVEGLSSWAYDVNELLAQG